MEELISLKSYPIDKTLKILLQDKTTRKNIIWATNSYKEQYGPDYDAKLPMSEGALTGLDSIMLQPRVLKSIEEQKQRTRGKAEVFTPAWICNKMNNYCDEDWFGRKDVFNIENEHTWNTTVEPVAFDKPTDWQKYVDSRRLEITCGEAPFLVSRYDASTGEYIPVGNRIGVLDRKLRVVNENTTSKEEWMKWVVRAFQSTYGYEFQGDNLLIGRINLMMTFFEYYLGRWKETPEEKNIKKLANIIAWNLWQMDGLSGRVPLGAPRNQYEVVDLFGDWDAPQEEVGPKCRIYDWRLGSSILYEGLKGGVGNEVRLHNWESAVSGNTR